MTKDEVPLIVVDAANVVGSRPDGWWRDRAGAARRLLTQLTSLKEHLEQPTDVVVVLEGGEKRSRRANSPGRPARGVSGRIGR